MEIAAASAVAAVAAIAAALFSSLCADHGGEQELDSDTRAAEPLIVRGGGPKSVGDAYPAQQPSSSTKSSSSAPPPAPAPLAKFRTRPAAGEALVPIAASSSSAIFCRCGGNGSLVRLLPCEHQSLCLACAQLDKTCPTCKTPIEDSEPSFRVA
jgi:hypothetical protein